MASKGANDRAGVGSGGATNSYTIGPGGDIIPVQNSGTAGKTPLPYKPPPGSGQGPSDGVTTTGPQGGTDGSGTTGAQGDFSNMLGIYGLPSDVQAKVNQIFAQTSDVQQATALALAYIRGTSWYAQTYPGIQEGLQSGLFNNEADYRSYVSAVDQISQQYNGSNVTADQIHAYITAGYNPSYIGRLFQGQATVAANGGNWQEQVGQFGEGKMTPDQLTALGNESAGIDTSLGQQLQNHLQTAVTRMTKAFNGVVATPQLSLAPQGLVAPGLAGQKQPGATGSADVGA